MLANKIDTEAIMAQASAYNKHNVGFETLMGGIQGGLQGYSMASSFSSKGVGTNDYGSEATQLDKEIFG